MLGLPVPSRWGHRETRFWQSVSQSHSESGRHLPRCRSVLSTSRRPLAGEREIDREKVSNVVHTNLNDHLLHECQQDQSTRVSKCASSKEHTHGRELKTQHPYTNTLCIGLYLRIRDNIE